MIFKETQTSLMDFLVHIMPDLKDVKFLVLQKPRINKEAVTKLMHLYENNSKEFKKLDRPDDMNRNDLDLLIKEELVREIGGELEVTAKGIEVIKTNILGDDRSSFEDDGEPIDYETALANTKPKRTMTKGAKTASLNNSKGNWYKSLRDK